jgi:DNA-binding transcriptional LysR family regulator
MTVELRQLRYFVAVAEERHFGRAAARLGIAQPGISQQIMRLERWLGVPLFVRDKRHVEVTPAGEVLLEHARLTLELADRAVASTRAAAQGKTGFLKVGAYSLGIYPVASELLQEFGKKFPQIDIEFHPGHSRQSLEALTRRMVDIAVVFAPFETTRDVNYIALGLIEPVVVLPFGHRLAQLERIPRAELLQERFFAWPRDLNPPLVDHMRALFFGETKHDGLIEIGDMTEMLLRVAAGEGVTITNPTVVGLEMSNVVIRKFEDPAPQFEYGVVWLEPCASPFVPDLVALAREFASVPS